MEMARVDGREEELFQRSRGSLLPRRGPLLWYCSKTHRQVHDTTYAWIVSSARIGIVVIVARCISLISTSSDFLARMVDSCRTQPSSMREYTRRQSTMSRFTRALDNKGDSRSTCTGQPSASVPHGPDRARSSRRTSPRWFTLVVGVDLGCRRTIAYRGGGSLISSWVPARRCLKDGRSTRHGIQNAAQRVTLSACRAHQSLPSRGSGRLGPLVSSCSASAQ